MIKFYLTLIFLILAALYIATVFLLIFAWRHTIRPLRFWLVPSTKVLVRRVIR